MGFSKLGAKALLAGVAMSFAILFCTQILTAETGSTSLIQSAVHGDSRPAVQSPVAAESQAGQPETTVFASLDLPRLVGALVQVESQGDSDMVGKHGERGLMQLKAGTWEEVTTRLYGRAIPFRRAFEPELNLSVGTAYLMKLREFLADHRDEWQADERSLLCACYNCGPTRVCSAGFALDGLPQHTQDYVERALALADDR